MMITVDPDPRFHDRVVEAVAGTPWARSTTHASNPDQVPAALAGAGASLVVIGPRVEVAVATGLARRLSALPEPVAVLLFAVPSTDVLRSALRAGIRDVLSPDADAGEVREAIRLAAPTDGGAGDPGITVTVFSSKGGVGTSTIAAALAVRLGDRVRGGSVLVDLDLASPDQAIMHAQSPRWTLQHVADGTVGADVESLEQVLVPLEDSRARLLPGPLDPALAETITSDAVSDAVRSLRGLAAAVVLDTASSFDDVTLAAIDAADVVVLVSGLDVASLRALTVSLQTLSRLGVAPDAIRVVLTRSDSRSGLQVTDVERAIGREVDVQVPSTRAAVRAMNEGVSLAVKAPRSGLVAAVDELVDSLLTVAPPEILRPDDDGGRFAWLPFVGRDRTTGARHPGTAPATAPADASTTPAPVDAAPVDAAPNGPPPPPAAALPGEAPPADVTESAGDVDEQDDATASEAVDEPATADDGTAAVEAIESGDAEEVDGDDESDREPATSGPAEVGQTAPVEAASEGSAGVDDVPLDRLPPPRVAGDGLDPRTKDARPRFGRRR